MSENQEPNNAPSKPQENGGVAQKAQETVQKAKKFKETAQKIKKLAHAIKNISAAGPLMTVLFWAFVVIVIIIIIIGILMFLITMPGMVMGKLKELFAVIGNSLAAFFGADTTEQIDKSEMFDTLKYIEDMGWDLKGEGFLTGYYKLEDEEKVEEELDDLDFDFDNQSYTIDKDGVVRSDDKIVLAQSDFMFTYIMSDNYVYTLKNDNIATQREADGFWEKLWGGIKGGGKKVASFLFGPLMSDSHNDDVKEYGKGLISLFYDKSDDESSGDDVKGFGKKGDALDMDNIWEDAVIKIDAEEKTLLIENDGWFNNNNPIEFSLDGWTGRYGMPLEFLLSVHKATMMPDLAYDMVYTFNTNINIYLFEISGSAVTYYKDNNGKYISVNEIRDARDEFRGDNVFSQIVNFFDDLVYARDEAIAMYNVGVDMLATGQNGCGCTVNTLCYATDGRIVGKKAVTQDGVTVDKWYYYKNGKESEGLSDTEYIGEVKEVKAIKKLCPFCEEAAGEVMKKLDDSYDPNLAAYAPYIADVKNHWYRDVYFVKDGDENFVEYDYDYEALMKERWTLYETYTDKDKDKGTYKYNPNKAGEFIYFIIDAERKIQRRKWSVCIV